MCFVLFVGSRKKLPMIPWQEEARRLCTKELSEYDAVVVKHFTLPVVTYVGSDQGCGCGFRHKLLRADGRAFDEVYVANNEGTQRNHAELAAFLREHLGGEPFVELYGCWSGNEKEVARFDDEIDADELEEPGFCFREQGYYRVSFGGTK
jgi:hypothetical protein